MILVTAVLVLRAALLISATNPTEPSHEPGTRRIQPEGAPSVDEWENKLRGHKIFLGPSYHFQVPNPSTPNFDFPENTRFLFPDSVSIKNWVEERLNVRLDWDGTVTWVGYG
ncbi:hypothetical protein ONS96_007632 [Cadophora gregata f. sp. sojae]|nr:hypothetical protein ONS96_007632 [Cadophora gregata f. sp. sojae]